uniref:Uncharacterized protein n=1 Tax=Lactuca sativa TaxID=4236 RepID=A0A9R1WWL9_LACSA|nr:hypothetical protein LSAT_V11C800449420 [Lactuca sativa]
MMVLRGDFEGDLQCHEVPKVEMLLAPAKVCPIFKGDVLLLEAGVRAASLVKGSGVASGQFVSQSWSAAVNSALEEDIGGYTIGRHLRQKRNIDPLLARSPIFIKIADGDDPQGMETAGFHRLGEPGLRALTPSRPRFQVMPSAVGPLSLGAPGMYLPGWSLTPISLLSKQGPTREWCRHVFPSATLEALDALSYSHMENDLQYVVAQVAPYLVAVVGRLCYIGADLEELDDVKSEHDKIVEKVWHLKEERCKFGERYLVLSGEKTVVES